MYYINPGCLTSVNQSYESLLRHQTERNRHKNTSLAYVLSVHKLDGKVIENCYTDEFPSILFRLDSHDTYNYHDFYLALSIDWNTGLV